MLEVPIFVADLKALLGITSASALRAQIKSGKVPPPDVQITQKTRYWHRSTLERLGLIQAQSQSENA